MSSLNRVFLIGRLGKDPETRYMPSGGQVTNVTIATSDKWKDKTSGEMKESTEWHRVVFFGKLAEVASEYLSKGSQVHIEGKLQTRKWQDKSGQDRYTTEIVGSDLVMLGSRGESKQTSVAGAKNASSYQSQHKAEPEYAMAGAGSGLDADIPF